MTERITLRLKSDPSVVLPEAGLRNQSGGWYLTWGLSTNYFSGDYWELVPPPYVLPVGLGSVIRASDSKLFVRTGESRWLDVQNGYSYEDADILADWNDQQWVTLSEGVEL